CSSSRPEFALQRRTHKGPERMAADLDVREYEIRRAIEDLGPWFHNLRINGIETAPDHFLGDYPTFKWETFSHVVPEDLEGRSVLDIGCNAGFYAIEMKRRNAGRVVGIDSDPRYLRQATFAAEHA